MSEAMYSPSHSRGPTSGSARGSLPWSSAGLSAPASSWLPSSIRGSSAEAYPDGRSSPDWSRAFPSLAPNFISRLRSFSVTGTRAGSFERRISFSICRRGQRRASRLCPLPRCPLAPAGHCPSTDAGAPRGNVRPALCKNQVGPFARKLGYIYAARRHCGA